MTGVWDGKGAWESDAQYRERMRTASNKAALVGEIRAVTGGYGLMLVAQIDEERKAAGMIGHSGSGPNWFYYDVELAVRNAHASVITARCFDDAPGLQDLNQFIVLIQIRYSPHHEPASPETEVRWLDQKTKNGSRALIYESAHAAIDHVRAAGTQGLLVEVPSTRDIRASEGMVRDGLDKGGATLIRLNAYREDVEDWLAYWALHGKAPTEQGTP